MANSISNARTMLSTPTILTGYASEASTSLVVEWRGFMLWRRGWDLNPNLPVNISYQNLSVLVRTHTFRTNDDGSIYAAHFTNLEVDSAERAEPSTV
jgi:hypothetical protein